MRSAMNSNNVNTRASPNPRFASVRSKLDTGHNMRKVMAAFEGTSGPNAHKKRKDEFFTRLRPSTLGMLIQVGEPAPCRTRANRAAAPAREPARPLEPSRARPHATARSRASPLRAALAAARRV